MSEGNKKTAPPDFDKPIRLYMVSDYCCPVCAEKHMTFDIHNRCTYICGNDGYRNDSPYCRHMCEGTRFAALLVRPEVPEPQEP